MAHIQGIIKQTAGSNIIERMDAKSKAARMKLPEHGVRKVARVKFPEYGLRIAIILAVTMALTLNAVILSVDTFHMYPVLSTLWLMALVACALQWKSGATADYAFVLLLFGLVIAAYQLQPKADSVLLFESVALLLATCGLLVVPIPQRRVFIVFGIMTAFVGGYVLATFAGLELDTAQTVLVLWFSLIALSGVLVRSRRETLAQINLNQIEYAAAHDTLTNLLNRRGAYLEISKTIESARMAGESVAIALIDIDGFKRFNDTFGHYAGDSLLREVGQCVQQSASNEKDVSSRWGGDEFLACWYGLDEQQAMQRAESLRKRIIGINTNAAENLKIDASIGTVIWRPLANDSFDEMIRRADKTMYEIKRSHYANA